MHGFLRIQTTYRGRCAYCATVVPRLADAWWKPALVGTLICEACYARIDREAAVHTGAALERADRDAREAGA